MFKKIFEELFKHYYVVVVGGDTVDSVVVDWLSPNDSLIANQGSRF